MPTVSGKLIKVFVYGTLKRGEPNHYWLTRAENGFSRFLAEGKTVEKFPLVVGTRYNIPFLLDKRGTGHNIHGEVYEVDESMLGALDVLEDYPKYYDREVQDVNVDNTIHKCWLYLIRNFPEELLAKEYLTTYRNTPERSYCERSQRNPQIKANDDLSY